MVGGRRILFAYGRRKEDTVCFLERTNTKLRRAEWWRTAIKKHIILTDNNSIMKLYDQYTKGDGRKGWTFRIDQPLQNKEIYAYFYHQ